MLRRAAFQLRPVPRAQRLILCAALACLAPARLHAQAPASASSTVAQAQLPHGAQADDRVETERLSLVDASRQRAVPVLTYVAASKRPLKPAILSHGYGLENGSYSFLATYLAERGYYVASIQHDLPGDAPIPSTGNVMEVRLPFWTRGAQNILFVLGELKKTRPDLDYDHLLLVGHSNGGDISMLFAREHPALVDTVISLDNRRMPFPRSSHPRVCSLRSSDQPADDGVLPTRDEQARYGMKVVKLPATIHNDMCDGATDAQKAEMLRHIGEFLGIAR